MFYTVYKTTNLINGKFYIGTHKTSDPNDSYLGSGKLLKKAIEKYEEYNFKKEVLFVFDNPEAMFAKEAEIVTAEFLSENNTYNLKLGGFGGFDHLNSAEYENPTHSVEHMRRMSANVSGAHRAEAGRKGGKVSAEWRKRNGVIHKAQLGVPHTEQTKAKISAKMKVLQAGTRNSQFGTKWQNITDGTSNRKIPADHTIPDGWYVGQVKRIDKQI